MHVTETASCTANSLPGDDYPNPTVLPPSFILFCPFSLCSSCLAPTTLSVSVFPRISAIGHLSYQQHFQFSLNRCSNMRLFSRAVWPLVASLACLGTVANAAASDPMQASLVFPRNETYAPTDFFPIVFAIQNTEMAQYMSLKIGYSIRNTSNWWGKETTTTSHDFRWANLSDHEPFFTSYFFNMSEKGEGQWSVVWDVSWQGCLEESFDRGYFDPLGVVGNLSRRSVDFTIKAGAQPVDLVTATINDEVCTAGRGFALNVTGKTKEVSSLRWDGGDICAVVEYSSPSPTANPCQVRIDSATAASISASWTARVCNVTFPPDYCPPENEDNASQRLAVAGVASLAAAFGAFGFLLL